MKTLNPHASGQHQQVFLLLPWYLNKSLQTDELRKVENHLHSCLLCRRELVSLRKLSSAVKLSSDLDMAAEMSFAGLKAKLPSKHSPSVRPEFLAANSAPLISYRRFKTRCNRYLPMSKAANQHWAIAAVLVLAVIPLVFHFQDSEVTQDYFTLSAAKPESLSGAQLRVVFAKPLSKMEMDALLTEIQGELIDKPNSVGAYTIKISDANSNTSSINLAIDWLRKHPQVMLAEPVLQP